MVEECSDPWIEPDLAPHLDVASASVEGTVAGTVLETEIGIVEVAELVEEFASSVAEDHRMGIAEEGLGYRRTIPPPDFGLTLDFVLGRYQNRSS